MKARCRAVALCGELSPPPLSVKAGKNVLVLVLEQFFVFFLLYAIVLLWNVIKKIHSQPLW